MKKIAIPLLAFTLAYAGYYMYSQKSDLSSPTDSLLYTDDMVASAQIFIERRAVLDSLKIDTNIFSDPVFVSYKSFALPIVKSNLGRSNPFGRTITERSDVNF